MLQVDNALAGDEKPDLSTTKKDKTAHGFGLLGMREIAKRYGGSFEVVAANGRFELETVVDFPIPPFPYTAILINPVFPLLPE